MLRRPPRSTLFPTRRSSDLAGEFRRLVAEQDRAHRRMNAVGADQDVGVDAHADILRSEEHTSELQSRQYLVCRLLLEKKKISRPNVADRLLAVELLPHHLPE